jgi:hypothetical protein
MVRIAADKWLPCPEGELDRLQSRLASGRLKHLLWTLVAAAAAAISVATATWVVTDAVAASMPPSFPRDIHHGCPPPKPCNQ